MLSRAKRHPDLSFALVMIVLTLAFYAPKFVKGEVIMGFDLVSIGLPMLRFGAKSILSGEIPYWDPYIFAGRPFLDGPYFSLVYPLNWPIIFSPTMTILELLAVSQIFLLGMSTYWFGKEIGLRPFPAAIAGLTFAFSEHTIIRLWMGHLSIIQIVTWIPLLFLIIHRLAKNTSVVNVFLGSIVVTMMLLPMFPQTVFHSFFAAGLFGLYLAWTKLRGVQRIRFLLSGVFMVLGGLALSAVQLVPMVESLRLSDRGEGVTFTFATEGSFPPWYLITAIAPDFFGTPPGPRLDLVPRIGMALHEGAFYVGVIPVLLAIFAVVIGFRKGMVAIFAVISVAFLVLSMGEYTPIYHFFYDLVPGYSNFRIPARHLIVVVFGLAVLAGWGVQFLWDEKEKAIVAVKMALAALVVLEVAVVVGYLSRNFALSLLAAQFDSKPFESLVLEALQIDNIQIFYGGLYDYAIKSLWLPSLLLLGFYLWWLLLYRSGKRAVASGATLGLLVVGGLFAFNLRMSNWQVTYYDPVIPTNSLLEREFYHQDEPFRVLLLEGDLVSPLSRNINAFAPEEKIEILNGYNPIILADYARFIELINGSGGVRSVGPIFTNLPRPDLISLLNVRYVVAGAPIPDDKNPGFKFLGQEDGVCLYLNPSYRPRAYLVDAKDATVVKDQAAAFVGLKTVLDPDSVIIEANSANFGSVAYASPVENYVGPQKVTIMENRNGYMKVAVETPVAVFLVLSELSYPGWNVFVDGQLKEILRADAVFRAVAVDPGEHVVEFRFVPDKFLLGGTISVIALAVFAVLGLFSAWRRSVSTR